MAASGLLDLLSQKMAYLTQRQAVIADNISNANTPQFKPHDLVPFDQVMQQVGGAGGGLKMVATNAGHLSGTHGVTGPYKTVMATDTYETKPSGNAVVLEEQMTQLSQNYTDYSTVTGLYHKTLSMIKTALSRAS